jgi:tyramine---L-glutamate ligase
MNIFAYEHITGGGMLGVPLPASLALEGRMMRDALVRDLIRVHGVQVMTLYDHRVAPPIAATQSEIVRDAPRWRAAMRGLIESSDAVWPIAPETGGELELLSRSILDAGQRLIGTEPETVRISASKRETHRLLVQHGIASVPTFRADEPHPSLGGPWVAKPDDGCGCEHTRLFTQADHAQRWIASRPDAARFVLQPYVGGEPLSLCALARSGIGWLLCVNRQRVQVRDGVFSYNGTQVNALPDPEGMFAALVTRIARAMPGLSGYFGVDVILSEDGPRVVDVNARLTTSWVGLRAALGFNPAKLVLDLLAEDGTFEMPMRGSTAIDVELPV